jgi:hypothetical protein
MTIGRVLASAAVMTLVVVFARKYVFTGFNPVITIALGGISGLIVYGALLLAMGEFREGKKHHAGG